MLYIQAMVGVAFSLGFLFGPSIGAAFSVLGRGDGPPTFLTFQYPAIFALTMSIIDVALIAMLFKESLPVQRRVSTII